MTTSRDTSADITLDNANEGIMNSDFEKWAKRMGYADEFDVPLMKHAAHEGWNARQPEIDALNIRADSVDKDNALLIARIDPLKAENAALKAENERLREDAEAKNNAD